MEQQAWTLYFAAEKDLKSKTIICETNCKTLQSDIEKIGKIIAELEAQKIETEGSIEQADKLII